MLKAGTQLGPYEILSPPERAGLLWGSLFVTPDGTAYAYRYRRVLGGLFLAEGLR